MTKDRARANSSVQPEQTSALKSFREQHDQLARDLFLSKGLVTLLLDHLIDGDTTNTNTRLNNKILATLESIESRIEMASSTLEGFWVEGRRLTELS